MRRAWRAARPDRRVVPADIGAIGEPVTDAQQNEPTDEERIESIEGGQVVDHNVQQ